MRIGKQLSDIKPTEKIDLSQPVTVKGTTHNSRIQSSSIRPYTSILLNKSVDLLYTQGYLKQQESTYRIDDLPIEIDRARLESSTFSNKPLIMELRQTDDIQWKIERVIQPLSMQRGQPQPSNNNRSVAPYQIPAHRPVTIPRPHRIPGRFRRKV